jgi:hypothetical protein
MTDGDFAWLAACSVIGVWHPRIGFMYLGIMCILKILRMRGYF